MPMHFFLNRGFISLVACATGEGDNSILWTLSNCTSSRIDVLLLRSPPLATASFRHVYHRH